MTCLCGHDKARHRGPGSCRDCGQFGCEAYEAAERAFEAAYGSDAEALAEALPPASPLTSALASAVAIAAAQPHTESTSAALARVTAERDELKAENASLVHLCQRMEKAAGFQPDDDPFTDSAERVAALRANYETLSSLAEGLRRTIAELTDERDAAKALYADAVKRLEVAWAAQLGIRPEWHHDHVGADDGWVCLNAACGYVFTPGHPPQTEHPCGPLTAVRITVTRRAAD